MVHAVELEKLAAFTMNETQKRMMSNGYNPKRSGDIQFTVKPQYFDGNKKGIFTRQRQPKAAAFAIRKRWLEK